MSFMFNFATDDGNEKESGTLPLDADSDQKEVTKIREFQELEPKLEKSLEDYEHKALPCGNVFLYHVIGEDDRKSSTDLIPNVYEGGMKIWECSIDLVEYLSEMNMTFTDKKVIELGCGLGLPALYTLRKGAAQVHLSDYNESVLKKVTIPTVHLNCDESGCSLDRCRFFAGDWSYLQKALCDQSLKYDLILTSETIYNLESYSKLHDLMAAILHDNGEIYLSAKTFYFGVGGGLRSFEEFVKSQKVFNCETCKVIQQGVQREILKLTRKS